MIRERFSISDEVELDISCAAGAVTIERSDDAKFVDIEIDSQHPDSWTVVQSGRVIEVRFSKSGWRRGVSARIRATAPAGCDAKIDTGSADLAIRVRAGRVDVKTASGDVRVDAAASLMVKTASGEITIGEVADDVNVSTASGDVSVASVLGDLVITTASGDTRVGRATGRVRLSTASGDVTVDRYEGASFTANVLSGDITLGVPTGRLVHFDAKTLSGRVECPEPRSDSGEPVGELVRLSVTAKSVSGDICLRRAD